MRVRTVIDMLGCLSYIAIDESLLDRDVIVRTADISMPDTESVLSLARFGGRSTWHERAREEGILLVHVPVIDVESLEDLRNPPMGVIFAGSKKPYDEFLAAFRHLPEQCALLSLRRNKLHEAFLHSYDVQQFANKAHSIIGNPIIITNSDHRLLASAGEIPEDREDVIEVVECGYLSDSVNAGLEADGIIRDVRLRRHAVLTVSPRYGARWAHSIVYVHHMEMGRFDVLESDKLITPLDLDAVAARTYAASSQRDLRDGGGYRAAWSRSRLLYAGWSAGCQRRSKLFVDRGGQRACRVGPARPQHGCGLR